MKRAIRRAIVLLLCVTLFVSDNATLVLCSEINGYSEAAQDVIQKGEEGNIELDMSAEEENESEGNADIITDEMLTDETLTDTENMGEDVDLNEEEENCDEEEILQEDSEDAVSEETVSEELVTEEDGTEEYTEEPLNDATYSLKYTVSDGKATITGYDGTASGDLVIPDTIGGYSVIGVGSEAFYGCNGFTGTLTISDSVVSVGDNAFMNCSGFNTLVLGSGLKTIGEQAFRGCTGFNGELFIPQSVTKIWERAFYGCSGFSAISYYTSTELAGTTVFYNCVEPTVLTYTFTYTVSDGTATITGLEGRASGSFEVPAFIDGYPVVAIAANAFSNRSDLLGNLILSEGLIEIGESAFCGCTGLGGKLVIPSSVTSIGGYAFSGCSGFTGNVEIFDNVRNIGDKAFSNCTGINEINIPSKCTLGNDVFNGCRSDIIVYRYVIIRFYDDKVTPGNYVEGGIPSKKIAVDSVYRGLPSLVDRGAKNFVGWFTQPSGGSQVTERTIFSEDVILYSRFREMGISNDYIDDAVYTGTNITPNINVLDGYSFLQLNVDYQITYKNNTNVYTLTESDAGFDPKKAPSIIITSKGNYKGKETVYFTIQPAKLYDASFKAEDIYIKANGKAQKPTPQLTWNGKTVAAKGNYSISYYKADDSWSIVGSSLASVTDAGKYVIRLTGTGNFDGIKDVHLTVASSDKVLVSKLSVSKVANQTYNDGYDICPEVTVKNGKTTLVKDTDYVVSYADNYDIGKASITITGKEGSGFVGTKVVNFNIVGTAISKATVEGLPTSVQYNGSEIYASGYRLYIKATRTTPEIPLSYGTDYIAEYQNNVNNGTATILFKGINGYSGTLKKTFKIVPYTVTDDSSCKVQVVADSSVVYSKGGAKPGMNITFVKPDRSTVILEAGKDYTVSYKNNTAVNDGSNPKKVPTVTINFKGAYKGKITRNFTVTPQNIRLLDITVADKAYQKKKNIYASKPVITDFDGKTLAAGVDYDKELTYKYVVNTTVEFGGVNTLRRENETVSKEDIIPAGTYIRVEAAAKTGGNYTGVISEMYRITEQSIASAKITVKDQIYTGSDITVDSSKMTVKIGKDTVLTEGTDFVIDAWSYQNNIKQGTASFAIKGIGNYGGTKKATFKIKTKDFKWWWR